MKRTYGGTKPKQLKLKMYEKEPHGNKDGDQL